MQLSKAEKQLILFFRSVGGLHTFEDIEQRQEELKKEFDELTGYKAFMDNHPTHEISIKSYSDEKSTSFKANISKENMGCIAEFLVEKNLEEQRAANEAIKRYKGVMSGN